jgi:hypothetical protein
LLFLSVVSLFVGRLAAPRLPFGGHLFGRLAIIFGGRLTGISLAGCCLVCLCLVLLGAVSKGRYGIPSGEFLLVWMDEWMD